MIKKIIFGVFVCALGFSSCAPLDKDISKRLDVRTFLVLPFSQSPQKEWEDFRQDLIVNILAYSDFFIINRDITIKDIEKTGVRLGESFGSLDFMEYPANGRLRKLRKEYNANTLIFGSMVEGDQALSVHLQVIDLDHQTLLVSVIKDLPIDQFKKKNLQQLSKECAKEVVESFKKISDGDSENYLWRYNEAGR